MSFIETSFGKLPDKQSFIIPQTFRDGTFEENRSYYSNLRFLEILKKQPSLYDEHLFLYKHTGDILYEKLLDAMGTGSYIKKYVMKPEKTGDNIIICDKDKDTKDIYKTDENAVVYTPYVEKQLVEIIKHKLPVIINAYLDSDDIFKVFQASSIESLKNLQGEALDHALKKLSDHVIYMINDTIETYCDGKINQNPSLFLISAIYASSMMLSKQYSYTISKGFANDDMICDLLDRYAKNIKYVLVNDLERLADKHNILTVLLSPTLFKKVDPFAEELSRKVSNDLKLLRIKYMDRSGNTKKFSVIDIDSENNKILDNINQSINDFFISLNNVLTMNELKEFLTETTIFDEFNPERIALIENMDKLMKVIIDDYVQSYKLRDRTLILPLHKTYQKMIKKGTMLYRGYKKIYKNPINDQNSFSFFSFNPVYLFSYIVPESKVKTLENYLEYVGGIAVYKLKKDIEVLDLSNFSTVQYVKKILSDEDAPEHVIDAFERSWIIPFGEDRFLRSSVESSDLTFMSWLCSKGYGGYLGMDVPGMHDEIAICFSKKDNRYDVEDIVDYIGTIDPEKYMNFPIIEEPYISYPLLNLAQSKPKPNKDKI